jgi:hypothetical protein
MLGRQPHELSLLRGHVLGPQRLHHGELLLEHLGPYVGRKTLRLELLAMPAPADSQDETAIGQDVQRGDCLG